MFVVPDLHVYHSLPLKTIFGCAGTAKNPLPGVAGERAEEIPARRALAPDSGAAQNGKSRKISLPHKSTRMSISFDKYILLNKNDLFNNQNSLSPPKNSPKPSTIIFV
jgi:hypothetical protein